MTDPKSTLSNVNTRGGGAFPPYTGFVSDVIPESSDLQKGVSVRFALDPTKQWFVLRVSYGRSQKIYEYLVEQGVDVYLPVHYVERTVGGKCKRLKVPLLPNILFAYATPSCIETYVKHTPSLNHLTYYYNHFILNPDGKNPPLTIPYSDMMNFIRVTSVGNEHVRIVNPERCHFKSGDVVEVTDGDFVGVQGRVARVAGQSCVVVEIVGLCLVATAYVPSAFLKKVESGRL